jgi:hypothetical protein
VLLFASLAALIGLLSYRGAEFYRLDLESRVEHAEFRKLSPGAPLGHGYGVTGTLMIFTNLLYLLRRRFARWRLGSMRRWLDVHVFTGLFGSALVVFHSAFQLRSQIASLTAWALALVVLSGIVGRYFYALALHRRALGLTEELALIELFDAGRCQQLMEAMRALPDPPAPTRATLAASVATIPAWLRAERARRGVVRRLLGPLHERELASDERRYLRAASRRIERAVCEPVRHVAGASLLRTWRGLHRFMALLMVVSVSVHITVAWVLGYRWIFE